MSQRTSFHLLAAYCLALGISGGAIFALGARISQRMSLGRYWLETGLVSRVTTDYLEGIVLAVIAFGGAIVVRAPLPQELLILLDDFSRRFMGQREFALNIRPVHGALLLARLTAIVPLFVIVGLLIGERRLDIAFSLAGALTRFLIVALIISGTCGGLAAWLGLKRLRWPLTTWFAIWVIPEIVRLAVPGSPTCRTTFSWLLSAAASSWSPN